MYTVHMKRITATQARKNWFRLLDEAAEGETILIEREGVRLVLHRQIDELEGLASRVPKYDDLIRVHDIGEADRWSWQWSDSEDGLVPDLIEEP